MSSATVCVIIGGQERDLEVEFKVTSYGYGGSYDEPPEGPEIEIEAITDADTGRDMFAFCTETRDLWGTPRHFGYVRFFHGMHTPTTWVRGQGFVPTGPREGYCNTECGLSTLADSIYDDICCNHMPEPDYGPDDY